MFHFTCALAVVFFFSPILYAQDTFTGSRGFAPAFRTSSDTPAPGTDLSIQVPGNVELNACVRWVGATGDRCVCQDDATDQLFFDKDCSGTLETGAGEFYLGSGGGGTGLEKVITDAINEASAFIAGDSVSGYKIWGEGDQGYLKCFSSEGGCNGSVVIATDKTLCFYDEEGDAPMFCFDPDAGSKNLMYQFQPGYEPLLSMETILRPIGDCTVAEESISGSDGAEDWITCADGTGDGVTFSYRVTPKTSTAVAARVVFLAVNKNASPTGTFELTCAAQSVRPGLDAYAAHDTTGEQPASFTTFGTQNRPEEASTTFTINGTVATGSHIKGQCNVTAAPGQIADIRLHGIAVIELLANSLSD